MIECSVWWATPLAEPDGFVDLLTASERERYLSYRQESDRSRFITGRVLAKTLVGRRLGRFAREVEFDASCTDCDRQHGPPRVPGSAIRLSISHSGELVGVALTEGAPIGLDVERAGRKADDALLEYALNEDELAGLRGLPAEQRAEEFFRYWTRKEALMKATGRGLRIPLRAITLAPPGTPPALVSSTDPSLSADTAQLADLCPQDGYRAAVAVLTSAELTVAEHASPPLAPRESP